MSQHEIKPDGPTSTTDEERRAFLRKGVYAAYATPVILSLLVENANAARSWGSHNCTPPPPPPQ